MTLTAISFTASCSVARLKRWTISFASATITMKARERPRRRHTYILWRDDQHISLRANVSSQRNEMNDSFEQHPHTTFLISEMLSNTQRLVPISQLGGGEIHITLWGFTSCGPRGAAVRWSGPRSTWSTCTQRPRSPATQRGMNRSRHF